MFSTFHVSIAYTYFYNNWCSLVTNDQILCSKEGNCIMDAQRSQPTLPENGAKLTSERRQQVSRRTMLKLGALGLAASTLGILEAEAWLPYRIAHAAPSSLPAIQFDISNYIAPARTIDGVLFRFG